MRPEENVDPDAGAHDDCGSLRPNTVDVLVFAPPSPWRPLRGLSQQHTRHMTAPRTSESTGSIESNAERRLGSSKYVTVHSHACYSGSARSFAEAPNSIPGKLYQVSCTD